MTVQMVEIGTGRYAYRTPEELKVILEREGKKGNGQLSDDRVGRFCETIKVDAARWQKTDNVVLAKKHLEEATKSDGESYGRWDDWILSMRKEIAGLATPLDALHHAQQKVPFDHRELVRDKSRLELYGALLFTEFPWFAKEINEQGDEKMSQLDTLGLSGNEKPISNIFYWHLRTMLACQTCFGGPKRVGEIGGGYGALARLWLQNGISPIEQYVIFDIPESLFFAEVYLSTLYPDAVAYFGECTGEEKIVLVPIDKRDDWKGHLDLVISTGSMQEMSQQWVHKWMEWLDRSDVSNFYSLNYAGQMASQLFESRNMWSPALTMRWRTIAMDSDPPLVAMMSPTRGFCEGAYEKGHPMRNIMDWSVFRGMKFNRKTYLEGLDLVRQFPTRNNIWMFLDACMQSMTAMYGHEPKDVYKEMALLAKMLVDNGDERGRMIVNLHQSNTQYLGL